ncbi:hypothetical protein D3C71_1409050 [compost metagenome]
MRVKAAGPFHHDLGGQGADRQAVAGEQPGASQGLEALVRRRRLGLQGIVQGFAQGIQFGDMVVAALDVFAHPFRRAVGGGGGAGDLGLGPVAHAPVGEGAVEAQDGVGGGGLILGQLHDLVARHGQTLKQGVGEGLGQFGLGGRTAGLAEVAQVHVIGLGQTQ